jgi:hypothetical protein
MASPSSASTTAAADDGVGFVVGFAGVEQPEINAASAVAAHSRGKQVIDTVMRVLSSPPPSPRMSM